MNAPLTLRYARTPWARMWGLLGRTSYDAGAALVFEHCNAVHTWFMSMPIDIVFVDKDWRVLSVNSAVGPWQTFREPNAFAVLELAGGEVPRCGIIAGDVLRP
jgi:uncharacterized protein